MRQPSPRERATPRKAFGLAVAQFLVLAAVATAIAGCQGLEARLESEAARGVRDSMLVRASLEMVRDKPWMGSGLGTWPTVYPRYAGFDAGVFVNQAHNDWAQWAAEGGLPFAFFLVVFAVALMETGGPVDIWMGTVAFLVARIGGLSDAAEARAGGVVLRCSRRCDGLAESPHPRRMMDHYEELGLDRSASPEEIRQAYKRLVRLLHPDRCSDEPRAAVGGSPDEEAE